ncbi:hypothetical protein TNCV_2323611 [Trichonephila clavipes]|nr:hypothetical protein TNCV_2323611 [Trichonephila clavipes]
MSSGRSLPQFNLGVQGGIQGDSHKLYGHSSPWGAGVDRHTLTSPSVVYCQYFQLIVLVAPLLSNSHHCGTVPLLTNVFLRDRKILLPKADNHPSFKLRKLLEFLLVSSRRHT